MTVIDPLIHEPCIWCGHISGDHTETCRETTGIFPVTELPGGLRCCKCKQVIDDVYVRHPRPTPPGETPECELVCIPCALDLRAT